MLLETSEGEAQGTGFRAAGTPEQRERCPQERTEVIAMGSHGSSRTVYTPQPTCLALLDCVGHRNGNEVG